LVRFQRSPGIHGFTWCSGGRSHVLRLGCPGHELRPHSPGDLGA